MLSDLLKQNDPTLVELYLRNPEQVSDFEELLSAIFLNRTVKCVVITNSFLGRFDEEKTYRLFNAIGSLSSVEDICISFSSIPVRALVACLIQARKLKILHLKRASFTGSDIDLLESNRALENHPSLEEFHLSIFQMGTKPGIEIDFIFRALSCISTLEKVYISLDTPAAISPPAFSALLRLKSLRRLSLLSCRLSDEHSASVATALQGTSILEYLQLCHTDMSYCGMQMIVDAIGTNKSLKTFCLANNNLSDQASLVIARSLRKNTTLENLDLHQNDFSGESGVTIAQALMANSNLKMLDLSNNNLTDDGGGALAQALVHNKCLEKLYLLDCNLSNTSCSAIARALTKNEYLKCLNLNMNHEIGSEGAESFVQNIRANFSMEHLEIPLKENTDRVQLNMFLKLNRLGRANLIQNRAAGNIDWIEALGNVSDDLDSLFYYLTSNPTLCLVSSALQV